MSDAAAPPVVRLKIPCSDSREFLERFAPRYAHGGVFVPGGRRPVGTRIRLKLEFRDGTVGVSGDALVTGQGTPEKPGMMLRFTALHPGSLQFELSPVGGAGPALTPARGASPAPGAPALTPARGTSPVPAVPALTPARGMSPVPAVPALTPARGMSRATAVPALTPARAMTPVPAAPPVAAGPGRGELVDELFGPEMMEEETAGSDRPLEIRTSQVKLKLKETPREPPDATPAPEEAAPSAAAAESEPAPPSGEPSPAGPPSSAEPPRGRGMRFGVAVALLGLGVVAAVGLAVAGALASRQARERSERLEAELKVVDARILEGRLTRPIGDSALDHLLAAKDLSAGDARVQTRLQALGDTFEQLGTRAAARGDLREAIVHLEAAVKADPRRAEASRKLEEARARLGGGPPPTR